MKIWYGYGFGALKVTFTVCASTASTLVTPSTVCVSVEATSRVGDVLPGEDDVVGREVGAVGPLDVLAQLPGDRRLVLGDAAVVERSGSRRPGRGPACRRDRCGQRLEDEAAGVVVLGALRQVRVQDGGRLPEQHLERAALCRVPAAAPAAAAAAAAAVRRRGRGRRGGWFGGGGGAVVGWRRAAAAAR